MRHVGGRCIVRDICQNECGGTSSAGVVHGRPSGEAGRGDAG